MNDANIIFARLFEEASGARSYFHTWWALRNLALPAYLATMNESKYVNFFQACNSGFLILTFVSLAKIFDRDSRAIGIRDLRSALEAEGKIELSKMIARYIDPHQDLVRRILGIRNKAVSHNQKDLSRDNVYDLYGVTPDEIRQLVDDVCESLNEVSRGFGSSTVISEGQRQESAVLKLLKTLESGRT